MGAVVGRDTPLIAERRKVALQARRIAANIAKLPELLTT
jgi:hypothetical protein